MKKSLLHFVFPAKCLHCEVILPPDPCVFCSSCSTELELISPSNHCRTCFNALSEDSLVCDVCIHDPSLYLQMGAAFEYEGPAVSLVKKLKYHGQNYLARGMAAFLLLQFERLGWPMPDALVPVPIALSRWLERGFNQSALLAEELGRLLRCPVWHALKRRSGDYRQAALNLEQRKALDGQRFYLSTSMSLTGKTLLVIDDVMTSGSTLQRCADVLHHAHPAALYALTFCRTQIH